MLGQRLNRAHLRKDLSWTGAMLNDVANSAVHVTVDYSAFVSLTKVQRHFTESVFILKDFLATMVSHSGRDRACRNKIGGELQVSQVI